MFNERNLHNNNYEGSAEKRDLECMSEEIEENLDNESFCKNNKDSRVQ